MAKIRVVITDDHALVRAGLRALLTAQPDLEVVGEASDGVVVVDLCRRLAPDVVLMDLTMPGRGGISAIQDLRETCPAAKILVVTMHEDETFARQALLAGAAGYVLKKSLATELINAIRAVHRGQRPIGATLAAALAAPERSATPLPPGTKVLDSLTPREREVVVCVALGHTNLEIAERLHISDRTVETHRKNITAKLGLRTRADLVRFALEYKLIGA
ncbi:MAG: response regulator transcription factor [Verrucomicrobia bacterium]|nr:response regulator transcription factor [Verrucomicrobiota bacterium]